MYYVLSKDIIESEIIGYLPERKRGFKPQVPLCEIINCILYKLKSGIQWHLLPVKAYLALVLFIIKLFSDIIGVGARKVFGKSVG
jgi:hypothetical protein